MLEDRTVLVSGVGPGLGRETAAAILREGGKVVAVDMIGDRVEAICADIDPGGRRTMAIEVDIASEEQCAAAVPKIVDRFGTLDGVVNVAAVDDGTGGLMDDGLMEEWDHCAEVNVKGTLRITRAMVPLMPHGGSIVLIGSTAFARPRRTRLALAYGMSKGALVTATYYLAEELGPHGIRTNTVVPGWKLGPVVEGYLDAEAARRQIDRQELVDTICEELSLRRMATDGDVANAAVFFLSDMAGAISGQTIFVDGGHVFR